MRSNNKNKTYTITAIIILLILFLPFNGFAMNSDNGDTLILLGNNKLAPIVYMDKGTAN